MVSATSLFSRLVFLRWLLLFILVLGCHWGPFSWPVLAQANLRTPLRWGDPAPTLRLQELDQRPRTRNPLRRSTQKQLLVLVFGDVACPAYHLYLGRILKLKPQVAALNGDWLWVYPHSLDSTVLPYPLAKVYRDWAGQSLKAYGVQRLPTVVLLQKEPKSLAHGPWFSRLKRRPLWTVRYVGAVDQDPEGRSTGVRQDLEEALRDLVHSPYVRIPSTRTHGCPLPVQPLP